MLILTILGYMIVLITSFICLSTCIGFCVMLWSAINLVPFIAMCTCGFLIMFAIIILVARVIKEI